MPKFATYTLAWSSSRQAYELYARTTPLSIENVLEEPAWFRWVSEVPSFAFKGKAGTYTARKELRHGDAYWYAYRRKQGKLYNTYIGKLEELTLDRLTSVAEIFDCDHKDERSVSASSKPLLKISQDASFQISPKLDLGDMRVCF